MQQDFSIPSLKQPLRRVADLPVWAMVAGIFILGFLVRNLLAYRLGLYAQQVNFGELESIGRSLAETGVFGNPYKVPTGPTAHGAPFYPYLLSLIFQWLGYGGGARAAVLVGATGCTALSLALLPWLAVRAGIPAIVGGAAGLFGALLPFRAITELSWEVPYAVCGWIVAVVVTLGWLRRPDTRNSLLCGATWGALFWVAPQLVGCFVLVLAASFRVIGRQRALRAAPLAALAAGVLILPWIVRGHRELGGWFFVRSNLGLELAISNFPGARPDYLSNCEANAPMNFCSQRHPFTSREEAMLVRQMGELPYHRARMREAMASISSDWPAFTRRTLARIVQFWFTPSGGLPWKDAVLYPITLLAFYGAWRMLTRSPALGWIAVSCLVAYPLPYYFINVMTRYIVPLSWLLYFLAFYAVAVMVAGKTPEGATARDPR